jgi:hypothetical protein
MATLPQLDDDQDPGAEPDHPADDASAGDEPMPDGGNPDHMIGYIDPRLPTKVRVFLRAARMIIVSPVGLTAIKKAAANSSDHVQGLAYLVAKTLEKLQDRLGPLTDQEHDQVATFITGWIVSTLQKLKVPGLDDAGARQDLIGRILQALDRLTGGQGQQGAQDAQDGPAGPQQVPPGGPAGPAAPPAQDDGGGTLPQLGD